MENQGQSLRPPADVERRPAGAVETTRANRGWWDAAAAGYQAEHGAFLGAARFVWGPEGLEEATAGLLGPVAGRRVLEVGCGGGACARWLAGRGALAVGLDLSAGMLATALELDRHVGVRLPWVQADGQRLPFRAESFDLACSAYGALPFVADAGRLLGEVARVLRPGGRWVFAVPHPLRWAFPDDPGPAGLTASGSYFDRRAYVEVDPTGRPSYAEHHRTMGDWVRELVRAGLRLRDLVEPEWPAGHEQVWGGWSPLRGRLLPGTAIFVTEKPAR